MEIVLEPKKVTLFFVKIAIGLALAHFAGLLSAFFELSHVSGLVRLFHLGLERNISTLYSSISILFCSALLFLIALDRKRNGGLYYLYWMGLAVIFLFLSIDESVLLHESLSTPLRHTLNTSGFLYFAWVIPYGIALILILLMYLKFIITLPARTRQLFTTAGLLYITGVLGFELIGAFYREYKQLYIIITTCEELLEMAGIITFIYALLTYIDSELEGLGLRITSSAAASPLSHQGILINVIKHP